jgi:hypothetical protein
MACYLKLGETLPLFIQLGDGAKFPTTRVFAQVDEIDSTPIIPIFELTNNGLGNYTDENQIMPTNNAVKVTYFIRKSDGTSPEVKYNPYYVTEIFLRDLTGELIEDNLDAKISGVSIAVPISLVGEVKDVEILTGEVEVVAIEANIKDNEIIFGEVHEC